MVDRLNSFVLDLFLQLRREEGQGIVEYAIVLAFVAAIAGGLAATGTLQKAISGMFSGLTF